jgi:hypothetical protein
MSKMATPIGGKDRDALEAFVAQGDTSVPGVEMSDLNDGDILARTRENVNPNGQFQFVYIPDDGSENIVSDWVAQEHKKKLTRGWVDGVKSAIIGRAQSKIQDAKEAQEEARAKRIREAQFAEPEVVRTEPVGESDIPASPRSVGSPRPARSSRQQGVLSDPSEYVGEMLEVARERLRLAEEASKDIVREVLTARRDYEKWKNLEAALGGSRPQPDDSGSSVIAIG